MRYQVVIIRNDLTWEVIAKPKNKKALKRVVGFLVGSTPWEDYRYLSLEIQNKRGRTLRNFASMN